MTSLSILRSCVFNVTVKCSEHVSVIEHLSPTLLILVCGSDSNIHVLQCIVSKGSFNEY